MSDDLLKIQQRIELREQMRRFEKSLDEFQDVLAHLPADKFAVFWGPSPFPGDGPRHRLIFSLEGKYTFNVENAPIHVLVQVIPVLDAIRDHIIREHNKLKQQVGAALEILKQTNGIQSKDGG